MAGKAAREMIQSRLANTGVLAANSLPYFMEVGQNLLLNLADPALMNTHRINCTTNSTGACCLWPIFASYSCLIIKEILSTGYPKMTLDEI